MAILKKGTKFFTTDDAGKVKEEFKTYDDLMNYYSENEYDDATDVWEFTKDGKSNFIEEL